MLNLRASSGGNVRLDLALACVLALVAVLVPLVVPPIQQIRDSLYWAGVLDRGVNEYAIWNPHHLIYLPLVRLLMAPAALVCASCTSIESAQFIGLVSTAVAAALAYLICKKLSGSVAIGLAFGLALILSRVYWVFVLQVSPYVPAVAALALLVYLVVAHGERLASSSPVLLAVCAAWSLAVLLHQAAVMFAFAIAAYAYGAFKPNVGTRVFAQISLYSGSFVLLIYIAAFIWVFGLAALSPRAFLEYATRYGSLPDPTQGGFVNFTAAGLASIAETQLKVLLTAPWELRFVVTATFGLLLLALLAWHAFRAWRGGDRPVRLFLVTWVAVLLLFYLWATPGNEVPLVMNVVPIFALAALAARDLAASRVSGWAATAVQGGVAAAVLAAALAVGARTHRVDVLPMHASMGKYHELARLRSEAMPSRCVLVEFDQEVMQNLYYYFRRSSLEGWDLITWFYFGNESQIPFTWHGVNLSDHECLVIPGRYLSPAVRMPGDVSGLTAPAKWYSFVEFLLGIEYSGDRIVSTRCLSSSRDSQGGSYLVVQMHERCDARGLEGVMEQFDALLGALDANHGPSGFKDWFERYRAVAGGFRQSKPRTELSNAFAPLLPRGGR